MYMTKIFSKYEYLYYVDSDHGHGCWGDSVWLLTKQKGFPKSVLSLFVINS